MEACFNELSIHPHCADLEEVNERVDSYVQVVKETIKLVPKKIRYEHGLSNVWLMEDLSLAQYCFNKNNKNKGDFLISCVKKPYIEEGSEIEERFTEYDDVNLKKGEAEVVSCYGFYAAFLYGSFCVGFHSDSFWAKSLFTLQLTKEKSITEAPILCISKCEDFKNDLFIDWAINNIPIQVPQTLISPQEKTVSIRDDHGKDVLEKFANRLRSIPYIISVINSLSFNPQEKKFIRNVYDDGKIEIVLIETDKGFGVIVQTTATNMLETKWVAKYLREYFKHDN